MSKVYKVIRVDEFGRLKSALSRNVFQKEYAIGQPTLPEPGTKLFAFLDLEQALGYANESNGYGQFKVFEAEAENPHLNGWFHYCLSNIEFVRAAFAGIETMDKPSSCYNSTCVCDSITLIKEIENNNENPINESVDKTVPAA